MNQKNQIVLGLIIPLLIISCTRALADQESQTNPTFWDRFYGSYDATAKNWRDLPGIQYLSLGDGTPYIDLKPDLDTWEHRGTLGFKLGDGKLPFEVKNSRIEFGGASEEGIYKEQLNKPLSSNGPLVGYLKNPASPVFDVSGVLSSDNSYTFTHTYREYFIDYKWDHELAPQVVLTPKIGFSYSQLDQTNHLFQSAPQNPGYRVVTESINGDSLGLRTGLTLEVPLGHDFSFLGGSQITFNHNEADLTVHEFDSCVQENLIKDNQSRWSHTTDLTLGIQKKFVNAVIAVSGGVSLYSYVPRVVNPIKATEQDAHLGGQSAYSQYIQLSVAYEV